MAKKTPSHNEHADHRARLKARFEREGLEGFDDHQALELLLFYALPRQDTNPIAHRLLNAFGSLAGVFRAPQERLAAVEGMGPHAATFLRMQAGLLAKQQRSLLDEKPSLRSHGDCMDFVFARMRYLSFEEVHYLCLNNDMRLLNCFTSSSGGVDRVLLDIRGITPQILASGCTGVVMAHNHPSGVSFPSGEDVASTEHVLLLLHLYGINLLDHVIVTPTRFYSMRTGGELDGIRTRLKNAVPQFSVAEPKGDFS